MFIFIVSLNAEQFHHIMVKHDGVINAIKKKAPWLTQQVDIRVNQREDDSDSDEEDHEDDCRVNNEALFERTLTKTMVKKMIKTDLINELQKRGANTEGSATLLR